MPDSDVRPKNVTFETFDPNNLMTEKPLWAVFDGYNFRTFSHGRGPAIQSFMTESRAKLYEMVDGRWVLRATMDKDPGKHSDQCDRCGMPAASTYSRWRSPWQWEKHGTKIATPIKLLYLCQPCSTAYNY